MSVNVLVPDNAPPQEWAVICLADSYWLDYPAWDPDKIARPEWRPILNHETNEQACHVSIVHEGIIDEIELVAMSAMHCATFGREHAELMAAVKVTEEFKRLRDEAVSYDRSGEFCGFTSEDFMNYVTDPMRNAFHAARHAEQIMDIGLNGYV